MPLELDCSGGIFYADNSNLQQSTLSIMVSMHIGKLANRRRRGPRVKGGFLICKYCYNLSVKHQGLCTECADRPKEENKFRLKCLLVCDALHDLLEQSNISKKNVRFLQKLIDFPDQETRSFVEIVLEISQVAPRKKKRFGIIRSAHRPLWKKMKAHKAFDCVFEANYFETYGRNPDWPFELLDELYDLYTEVADSELPLKQRELFPEGSSGN